MDRNNFSVLIRTLAGGYLCYIAYGMFKDAYQNPGTVPLAILIFSVVFVIVGAALLIINGRALLIAQKEERRKAKEEAEKKAKEEGIPVSMRDRLYDNSAAEELEDPNVYPVADRDDEGGEDA